MKHKVFTKADDEFQKTAKELFDRFKDKFELDVEPEKIIFLRTDGTKKKYAYCMPIRDEYQLLTDKKFFIVIVSKVFDNLQTEKEKKHVILHELKHCYLSDSGKPQLVKHNLEDFAQLLKDPTWNTEII